MRKIMFTILYLFLCQPLLAQEQKTAEQVLAEMDSPTFVPTVKVGKVLYEGDSIQYMEMNNVYVYPQLTFKNKKQAETYMRLVNNVKKVLPIAKEARQMLCLTCCLTRSRRMNTSNVWRKISSVPISRR